MIQIHINLSLSLCGRFIIIVTDFNFRTLCIEEYIYLFQKRQNYKIFDPAITKMKPPEKPESYLST